MLNITIVLLYFLAVALCFMMLKQGWSRSVDFFSVRNLYLFGFVVYQALNPATALYTENFTFFRLSTPTQTGKIYLLYAYVFVGVFLLSYHKLKPSRWFARKFPAPKREISDSVFLGVAIVVLLIAVLMRYFGHYIPGLGIASVQSSIALVAVGSCVAGWVWANRPLNPLVLGLTILIVGVGFAISMTGVFSRRPLIAIMMGVAWGAYYRRARYMPHVKLLVMLAPVLVAAVVSVGAFTAIRHNRDTATAKIQDTARNMANADISAGVLDIFGGQTCGSASLWAIEQWPADFKYKRLFSLQFMAYWYVPRSLWPDKPMPLSKEIASLARLRNLNRDKITIPPGVIGYAAAEGGVLAAIVYALFFGQFARFFDELIRLNPMNAFVILPIGCTTGQLLGLARGDLAIFTNLIVLGFVASYAILLVASQIFGRKSQQPYWNPWPQLS